MSEIRHSPFAGTWYPRDPSALRDMVETLLGLDSESETEGELIGLVDERAERAQLACKSLTSICSKAKPSVLQALLSRGARWARRRLRAPERAL